MIFDLVNLFLIILVAAVVIFLIVRSAQINSKMDTAVAEIKSKIGSMIKEINAINLQDYKVDLQQTNEIAELRKSVSKS